MPLAHCTMVTQLPIRIVEQHQGVYEQNSIKKKFARFCKTEPTKNLDARTKKENNKHCGKKIGDLLIIR